MAKHFQFDKHDPSEHAADKRIVNTVANQKLALVKIYNILTNSSVPTGKLKMKH
jgi:molybdopterin-containing oxidoreductase family iron-sulfur binding subunit